MKQNTSQVGGKLHPQSKNSQAPKPSRAAESPPDGGTGLHPFIHCPECRCDVQFVAGAVPGGIPAELDCPNCEGAVLRYTVLITEPPGVAAVPQPPGSAAVPLRRDTVHDHVVRGERQRHPEDGMEVEIHGLVPDCEFGFLTLLGFLCRVLDEHGGYLAKVVAPELCVDDQAALLEALAYATQWRYHEAKGESPKELHVMTLPGLAGQRVFPREEFFGWVCHLLGSEQVRESIDKHFLGASAPILSRVEWGEVCAVAESYLRRDGAVPTLAPEGRAAWKAAALLKEAGVKAEVAA